MKVPDNFILILVAAACLVGKHWFSELEPLTYILLTLLKPGDAVMPSKGGGGNAAEIRGNQGQDEKEGEVHQGS